MKGLSLYWNSYERNMGLIFDEFKDQWNRISDMSNPVPRLLFWKQTEYSKQTSGSSVMLIVLV